MQKIYDIGVVPQKEVLDERFLFPFPQINFLLNGGLFDRVTLITSSTDSGKTTFTSQIICDIINQGYKCCCFFGEDTAYESQDRIFKQSLRGNGAEDLEYVPYYQDGKPTTCGEWVLTPKAFQVAKDKFAGKLFLYNTLASSKVEDILEGFDEARTRYGCKVFVLDNCDQFEFASDNENKALKDSVIKIRDYAINHKVHIILISHIRKMEKDVILPDLQDVKGTSSLVNIAKNVLIIVRMDKVDKNTKEYKALHRLVELNNYNLDDADCLVKVAKTKGRKLGFACLKFNKKTCTFYECKKIDNTKEDGWDSTVVIPRDDKFKQNELTPITDPALLDTLNF